MYQQNMTQQNYGQQQQQQQQPSFMQHGRHLHLNDGDMANHVLNELKRVAREYATAALEAANPDIRHLFGQLLHQTLSDQEQLYQQMSRLNQYGEPMSAHPNDLRKELQNHRNTRQELQQFMQQGMSGTGAGMTGGQPMQMQRYGQQSQQGQPSQYGSFAENPFNQSNTPVYAQPPASSNVYGSASGGAYTSTAGDGAYGNVGTASTLEAFGASERARSYTGAGTTSGTSMTAASSDASETMHMTGSERLIGHTTGAAGSRHQTQTGGRYML